jgi:hypothetical protein
MVLPYWPPPELPDYKPGNLGRWACLPTPSLTRPTTGYFLPHQRQAPGWMFTRSQKIWMSLTQMEIESQAPMIAAAYGHTVIAGLGMGFALYNIAKKPEVTRVTLLEIDTEVIGLLDKVSDWRNWPGTDKVELLIGDARVYRPGAPGRFSVRRHLAVSRRQRRAAADASHPGQCPGGERRVVGARIRFCRLLPPPQRLSRRYRPERLSRLCATRRPSGD